MSEMTLEQLRKISPGTDWERVKNMRDEDIVFDEDSPDLSNFDWSGAVITKFGKVIGAVPHKQPVTLRLDTDILAWFKSLGPRYQTRINTALRGVMEQARANATSH